MTDDLSMQCIIAGIQKQLLGITPFKNIQSYFLLIYSKGEVLGRYEYAVVRWRDGIVVIKPILIKFEDEASRLIL